MPQTDAMLFAERSTNTFYFSHQTQELDWILLSIRALHLLTVYINDSQLRALVSLGAEIILREPQGDA